MYFNQLSYVTYDVDILHDILYIYYIDYWFSWLLSGSTVVRLFWRQFMWPRGLDNIQSLPAGHDFPTIWVMSCGRKWMTYTQRHNPKLTFLLKDDKKNDPGTWGLPKVFRYQNHPKPLFLLGLAPQHLLRCWARALQNAASSGQQQIWHLSGLNDLRL